MHIYSGRRVGVTRIAWMNREDFTKKLPSNQVKKDELEFSRRGEKGSLGSVEKEIIRSNIFQQAKSTEARLCALNTAKGNAYVVFML